jgi:hypothetical protein
MEGGSLFNPGYVGTSFYWWIGQIADDSSWRDNELAGKFKDKHSIPGWGKRYRVRIIGVHDKEEETIPSDQLPWANIMYPITAGGGQAGSTQTANLRQGMFVFGFWMDGQDMQVPVIMGVLGNNAQTSLNTKFENYTADSGTAQGKEDKKGNAKTTIGDKDKSADKPKDEQASKEQATLNSDTPKNKFGLPLNENANQSQLADLASAKSEVEGMTNELKKKFLGSENPSQEQIDNFIRKKVTLGMEKRVLESNSASSEPKPGATIECADALHLLAADDIKKDDKYNEKTILIVPDDMVGSSIKAMQTVSENLALKMEKYLGSIGDYSDAVSGAPSKDDINAFMKDSAGSMSKYMKVIMDKMMEYSSKQLNEELTEAISKLPSCMRGEMGDMMNLINENSLKKYNGITNKLSGLMEGILDDAFQFNKLEAKAIKNAIENVGVTTERQVRDAYTGNLITETVIVKEDNTHPEVPICSAESIIGQAISTVEKDIIKSNTDTLTGISGYLGDVKRQLDRMDADLETKAGEDTNAGKVLTLTDDEVLDNVVGGTRYKTSQRVGTEFKDSLDSGRSVASGFTTSMASGQGLTVDIVVPRGGLGRTGSGSIDFTWVNQGTGYTNANAVVCNGGTGTGMKVNIITSGGEITTIFTHTQGDGYSKGDELTIQSGNFDAKFTLDAVWGPIVPAGGEPGGVTLNQGGNGYVDGDVYTILGGSDDATILILTVNDVGDVEATSGSSGGSKPQKLGNINLNIGNIMGNMTAALNFENMKTNIFPFELPANPAVSDLYTLASGGEGKPDTDIPSFPSVGDLIKKGTSSIAKEALPFAEPTLKKTVSLIKNQQSSSGSSGSTNNNSTGSSSASGASGSY